MFEETSLGESATLARRRVVRVREGGTLPVAIIAHEGEDRDWLKARVGRERPVVTFPSLSHFAAEAGGRERWAGILLARTHAWDARLDGCVPRRAFIALFRLAEEGYGWPDAVKRLHTPEELDTWLAEIASPVLPADDRPRPTKPKATKLLSTLAESAERASPAAPASPARALNGQLELNRSALADQEAGSPSLRDEAAAALSRREHAGSERPRAGSQAPAQNTARSTTRPPAASAPSRSAARARAAGALARAELPAAKPRRAVRASAPLPSRHARSAPVTAIASGSEERRFAALALQIGLLRAAELLSKVRTRAHQVSASSYR